MAWDDEVAEAIEQVFDKEAGVGTSVTLRRVTPGAFSASTGARAETTADVTVGALRGPSASRTVDSSGRIVETRRYSLRADELGALVTPKAADRVIDGGITWLVNSVERSAEGECWELQCSRSGA